jgi:cobalamin biosynthesis Mg chelatase CobN
MEDYMKIMGDPEARKKYRDSILETAEALNLKGNHEMAWRLLENLETSNNVFINTKK